MMVDAPSFFNAWEPQPSFTPAPSDTVLAQRISKLAQFAARNGPSFVELIKAKQAANPEYGFLQNGEGADFWRWSLLCALHSLPPDQPQTAASQAPGHAGAPASAPQGAPAAYAAAPLAPLPPEVDSSFAQVLHVLSGSKECIKASRDWFLACAPHAGGMAARMAQALLAQPAYERQLHLIYLANDILLKSAAMRDEGRGTEADVLAGAFRPALPGMLAHALATAGRSPEATERLAAIVTFWADRRVFDTDAVAACRHAIGLPAPAGPTGTATQGPATQAASAVGGSTASGGGAWAASGGGGLGSAGQAAWAAPYPGAPGFPGAYPAAPPGPDAHAPAWGAAYLPPGAPAPAGYGAPGWYPPPGAPGHLGGPGVPLAGHPALAYPPPQASHGPPPIAPPPPDPMGFPPGLLPELVRDRLKTDAPYSALSPLDIEKAAMPAPTPPDAYLAARLEKFHAELRGYRPGMVRADLPDEQRRQRLRDGGDADAPPQRSFDAEAGADGSFARGGLGSGGSRAAGLGFSEGGSAGGASAPAAAGNGVGGFVAPAPSGGGGSSGSGQDEAAFHMYRRLRSGAYKETLARAQQAAVEGLGR
ncbi:hypothetical protein WJX81_001731 [Elliptochloris bilobata]|uniref:CID domain-containing protein n=1 Tax=Elliptochloris bilobata TaxID=381761 RepID=A0AAW1QI33_9CHLO